MAFNRQFSTLEMDILREIGNIGAGNAVTSMSKLINKPITMAVPSVNIIPFDEVITLVGGPESIIVGIYIRILGDAPGSVYFILSEKEAVDLIQQITDQTDFTLMDNTGQKLAQSVLQETGNILAGSYLSALGDFTKLNMQPSVPSLSIDMAGAIITTGLIELSQVSDYAIVIDTEVMKQSHTTGVHGHFLFLPDPGSFQTIFSSLGMDNLG